MAAARMAPKRTNSHRLTFFPKADAAVLTTDHGQPPKRPQTVGPVLDPAQRNRPVSPFDQNIHAALYPEPEPFGASPIPDNQLLGTCERYPRAQMAKNERLRLSMLWYYTRDILDEKEFMSGLQEKVHMAKESTEWDWAIIGILDVNYYTRLATIGLPTGILPRGETICAHTVNQPPNSVFLLPAMMEDWRFRAAPYVEVGGLKAYAGAPLRLQNENGEVVALGSLCVASPQPEHPLTKTQQQTLTHLADWIVSDIVQAARARRQRERRRMTDLLSEAQKATDRDAENEEPVFRILREVYPDATICLKPSKATHLEVQGRKPIPMSELEDGVWEDADYIDDFIQNYNHMELPTDRVVRAIATPCESIAGPSLLAVASRNLRHVFDDVDLWFLQTCAYMISQMWHKRLLAEVMRAKEKFLRGVSHQLRTPIHGILGSVDLLAEELKSTKAMIHAAAAASAVTSPGADQSVYLDTIKTSGRDLISIVNSMITLNRWADIAMTERSNVTLTIRELEADLAGEISKAIYGDVRCRASICFRHKTHPDADAINIDLDLIRNSLLPLLMNAVQNTPKGVVKVTLSLCSDSNEFIVDIEDNGCGIHSDDHKRIFEPYEKVLDHSTGAGLGLTIASKFTALLNGTVELVSSVPNQGSHFRATFRDIEVLQSADDSQLVRADQLSDLPQAFHVIDAGESTTSLCDHFRTCLQDRGCAEVDASNETRFTIVEFLADVEKRRELLSRVPTGTVVMCLVPASEAETPLEETPDNVVYVNGPFFAATIDSALKEAEKLQVALKTATATKPVYHEVNGVDPEINGHHHPEMDGMTSPLTILPPVTQVTLAPETSGLVNGDHEKQDLVVVSRVELQPSPVQSRIVIPILNPIASTAKPMALIVDDNLINLRIMQMYCRKRNLPFVCAADGAEAVEIFKQTQTRAASGVYNDDASPPPIQLILMDLQMPVCDGITATRQIRQLEEENDWGRSSVFIVTGQDNPTDRSAAESVGADEYFVKPVGVKVLDRGVKRYFPAFAAV